VCVCVCVCARARVRAPEKCNTEFLTVVLLKIQFWVVMLGHWLHSSRIVMHLSLGLSGLGLL
jgi:hypothetical protein